MAELRCASNGAVTPLGARLFVGRVPGCGLRLDDRRVSSMHAYLWWDGGAWRARDLGSRNGTWVDGRRLGTGEEVAINERSRLSFGAADAPVWVLHDDRAPVPQAVEVNSGQVVEACAELLAFPPDHPSAMVYQDAHGAWVLEQHGQNWPAEDGQIVVLEDGAWRLSLPGTSGVTTAAHAGLSLLTARLRFTVSRDNERVSVEIVTSSRTIALEQREHWWPVFVLARDRVADAQSPDLDQGWTDNERLERRSGLDLATINVYIYRARRQLAALGVEHAALLVEVRRGQRRLGLPPERLEIVESRG